MYACYLISNREFIEVKNKYVVLGALCAVFALPAQSFAATTLGDAEISANVGFVSEYSFRGITQSDEKMAIQGGFDIAHDSGLYAGVWGSNVDFNDNSEAQLEVDVYAGYSGTIKGLNYDLGAIYYIYPGANTPRQYDFLEAALSIGYDFDVFALSASINYSPDYFNESGDAAYYALSADVPLPYDVTLSGHIGRQNVDNNTAFGVKDYNDWSLGLGYNLEGFDLSVKYVDTSLDEPRECADGCGPRVIFGVSHSF